MFVVRFLSGAQQSLSLSCIFLTAHGKHLRTVSTMFAVRLWADAWQTFVFVVRPETDARQSLFTNGYSSNLERTLTFAVR
jgi:hypothetical protein